MVLVGSFLAANGRFAGELHPQQFQGAARLSHKDEGKEAVILAFPTAFARDATIALRAAGFRFNKLPQHWEGRARFANAEARAKTHGGEIRRTAFAFPPAAPAEQTAE